MHITILLRIEKLQLIRSMLLKNQEIYATIILYKFTQKGLTSLPKGAIITQTDRISLTFPAILTE